MTCSITSRILASLLYADIFHYPLTMRELTQWILSATVISSRVIQGNSKKLMEKKMIGYTPPFLHVSGHKKLIQCRIEKLAASTIKWKKIRNIAKILTHIPTICLVGVSGGLAVNNADTQDDIDLLIVAKRNTLWITRFATTILIELFSKRRHPGDLRVENAICLNMFLTENALQIPKNEQGWYTAHEVLQMVPLWQRNTMYAKYLHANRWTQKWFAGRYAFQEQIQVPSYRTRKNNIKWYQVLEQPLKAFQLWYMRERRTTEVISDVTLRFHPNDARIWIRKSFEAKLRRYKVPLDKKYNQI